ncbi:MAG: extracellular solute-binding protein [Spirochaetaceae bacterium]|nr:MAG: extracellular solute-binding protein [Spirochaetaceae bacterium]
MTEEGTPGLPLVQERVTLDYFMANHKTAPFTAQDLTIAELQRRTNVFFNIISIDSGYWDKYKVMLASNDLPDLIFTNVADAKRYGMEGLFLPLDELLEKHGKNILAAIEQEGIAEDMRALDGRIYFFPKISLQQPEPFMIRQDWLDACGLDTPETLEDLYHMLKTFKERDPAGGGQTIPYGSLMYNDPSICYLNAFYRAFTVDQDFMLKAERMVWGPAQPEMKQAMRYLNRLYAEGLLDPEAPILAKKQWEERVSAGRVGMIVYSSVRTDYFTRVLRQTDPEAKMIGMPPPIGIDGQRHVAPMPRFSTDFCMVVSKDSPHAELIVKFFDYVFSPEGRMIVSYGVEGDSYEIRDGKPVFSEKMYSKEAGWNMFVKAAIGGRRIACWPYDDAMVQQLRGTLSLEALQLTWPHVDPPTPILNFDQQELGIIETRYQDLKDRTSEFLLKFLTGELSVDAGWDDYIGELKRAGLDELEEAYNRAYARRYR